MGSTAIIGRAESSGTIKANNPSPDAVRTALSSLDPQALQGAWATQHTVYTDWPEQYWNSWLDPHRLHLLKAIQQGLKSAGQRTGGLAQAPSVSGAHKAAVEPVEAPGSILEVGCASGPNLRLFHAQWPGTDLSGVDVNKVGIDWGVAQARREGWRWQGFSKPLIDLSQFKTPHDVVVSCYTLAYIHPNDIQGVLQHLVRLTKKVLVLMEPMVGYKQPEQGYGGKLTDQEGYPEWWYDYLRRLEGTVTGECRIEPMPRHGHLNAVVTITRP